MGKIVPYSMPAYVAARDGALVFTIGELLASPNASRGGHWRVRHDITKRWETLIAYAVGPRWRDAWGLIIGTHRTAPSRRHPSGQVRPTYRQERRRVTIERRVPSRRQFVRDRDNLHFVGKPIYDALKRLGLVCEDSEQWLDAPTPVQRVSDDGRAWTVITIQRVDHASLSDAHVA